MVRAEIIGKELIHDAQRQYLKGSVKRWWLRYHIIFV